MPSKRQTWTWNWSCGAKGPHFSHFFEQAYLFLVSLMGEGKTVAQTCHQPPWRFRFLYLQSRNTIGPSFLHLSGDLSKDG